MRNAYMLAPTTITFLRVWDNLLIHGFASACLFVCTGRCLDELVATAVLVDDLCAHRGSEVFSDGWQFWQPQRMATVRFLIVMG